MTAPTRRRCQTGYGPPRRHKRIIEKHVEGTGSVLDVGCASGAFLRLMREAGWSVMRRRAIGSTIPAGNESARRRRKIFSNACSRRRRLQGGFDLVTMWDVLEHVTHPVEFLSMAACLLRPGGYVVLNVPRIDSPAARLLGRRWPVLLAEHLNYFTCRAFVFVGGSRLRLVHTGQRPAAFSWDTFSSAPASMVFPVALSRGAGSR